MTEQGTKRRPSRWARRSRGKRLKKRGSQKAMLEIAKLHSEGHSTTAIASRVHLPVSLVQDVIDVSGPEIEEGGAAATRGEGSR